MMRSLAQKPPAIPFDEKEVLNALQKFLTLPEFGRAWLLHLSGEPIGYVILTLGFSFEFRGTDAFIDEIYIEPKYRRQGYGRRAVTFVEGEARKRGVNALHLEVDGENDAAGELYRRAGYKDHGRHLMTKWLNRV
jgi:diamine N-acetyltransferase